MRLGEPIGEATQTRWIEYGAFPSPLAMAIGRAKPSGRGADCLSGG
jgi:hypothetical protein